MGVIEGVAGAVGLAPGLAVWEAPGVVIGLDVADGKLDSKVGVEEAIAVGVGALVQAASRTASAKDMERSKEFKRTNSNVLDGCDGPVWCSEAQAHRGTLDARCRSSP